MAQSKPRGQFAHRRTVRLIVDDDLGDIDALKVAKSLPQLAGQIRGIVPLFGGKCFDITLATSEQATRLALEGIDYEHVHKPLRLLGQRTIHVSIFVSVEFPDESLLNLLASYGELKSQRVRHLFFSEDGYTDIENGVRVVEFTRIDRDIPKRIVVGGLEIGFKYTGQPVTCHRCQSTEHVVKNCPKRRHTTHRSETVNDPPPPDVAGGATEEDMDETQAENPSPELFSTPSYAEAAAGPREDEIATRKKQAAALEKLKQQQQEILERQRKRPPPPPSGSDDEEASSKRPTIESETPNDEPASQINSTSESPEDSPLPSTAATASSSSTQPESSSQTSTPGLKFFLQALASNGKQRQTLMKAVHSNVFYRCRGCYLHYKLGNFSEEKVKRHKIHNTYEQQQWESLKGTVTTDAFGELVATLLDLQKSSNIFLSD